MNTDKIITIALRTVELETSSVNRLKQFIDTHFVKAVETIASSRGRLIVSGIGKSAIIAQKIVATLNSTGTPAVFMHAADAIHGDLGMIQADDIILVISKSGNSPEIKVLAPLVKNFGNTLIGMVGNMQSFLALNSDIVLNTTVDQEACPINLAPTSSTTVQMVMGDALAVCLMELKGFNSSDFAKYHPGGTLGKKLYLRVAEIAAQNARPYILPTASIKEVIVVMTQSRLGAAVVVNETENILGIITDGDLRRMLERTGNFENLCAKDIMSSNPKTIASDVLAVAALDEMRTNNISQLIVDNNGTYAGIIHLHDLVKEGII
jgi:arabinose-5-phosphate isomerase